MKELYCLQMSGRREKVRRRTANPVDQFERSQCQVRSSARGEKGLPNRAVDAVAPLLRNWPMLRTGAGELPQIRNRLDRLGRALLLAIPKRRHDQSSQHFRQCWTAVRTEDRTSSRCDVCVAFRRAVVRD